MSDFSQIPTPLELHSEVVKPEWIDHNGHMNSAYYVLAFDESGGSLFDYFGVSDEYRTSTNRGIFVADYHVHYLKEVVEGDPLRFTHLIIDCDEKKVHYWQEMYHAKEGYLAAQAEAIMLHVDLTLRKVTPFPNEIFSKIKEVYSVHKLAPTPDNLGKIISMKKHKPRTGSELSGP